MTTDPTSDGGDGAPPPGNEDRQAPVGGDAELMEVVVSVDDAHLPALSEVVSALESAGMVVDQTMAVLGTVAGRVPATRFDDVRRVDGVAAVEPTRRFQLPPPESDIQ